MSTASKNLSETGLRDSLAGIENHRFAVVVSEWNEEITGALKDACIQTLIKYGVKETNIVLKHVPGSFELPMGALKLISREKFSAVICLGCVIRGETPHFDYVCQATAIGIMNVSIEQNVPVIFGVLTTENQQQAIDRSGGKYGNKGVEAAATAIKMALQ
jgi:6,7-dimethyl-8-ribityllumazine synthase